MNSSSLGQEPAPHTFRELVYSELYAVHLGHWDGFWDQYCVLPWLRDHADISTQS